jgi:primosomal protein N' (replication factor Y)
LTSTVSPSFILRVAVPSPLRRLFDYLPLPDQPLPLPGARVRVPFGRQTLVGIVVGIDSDSEHELARLKPVEAVLDAIPLLDAALLQLYLWSSHYYLFPVGMALQTSLPAALREGKPLELPRQRLWQLTPAGRAGHAATSQRAAQQLRILELLRSFEAMSSSELSAALGKPARTALQALEAKQLVKQVERALPQRSPSLRETPLVLNAEQAAACAAVEESLGSFHCHLLEGITGSGKTEIYLQLIARVLERGLQVLVLVPEISLTPQTLQRFTRRFDCSIVALHSGLTDKQRHAGWLQAHAGTADIVIGTRSAIFTPLQRPGLIIIDEEHDDSYKQQEGFRYNARDVAVYRASQLKLPVLLGSATPSLETLHNALSGRYRHLQLSARAGSASLPRLQLVDMRLQTSEEGFSLSVREHISSTLAASQQVLVFLNRRGFAPLLQCQGCGWIAECPRCERSYTLHQQPAALRCHHCEASKPLPRSCPTCQSTQLGGIGMGTERSENFLRDRFPDYPVIRIDRDTTRAVGSLQEKMGQVHSGLPSILVGTQMLAKGHHFPRVTLVVVLDADSGLFSADFRGQENLGQLLTQVAGRAGRSDASGLVLIQSFHTTHPGLQQLTSAGYGPFARQLLQERQAGNLPPFSRLLLLRAEAGRRELPPAFLQRARVLAAALGRHHVQVYGPLPCPIGKKAGLFRFQLILQASQRQRLQRLAHALVAQLEQEPAARQVRWQLDVDPVDFS